MRPQIFATADAASIQLSLVLSTRGTSRRSTAVQKRGSENQALTNCHEPAVYLNITLASSLLSNTILKNEVFFEVLEGNNQKWLKGNSLPDSLKFTLKDKFSLDLTLFVLSIKSKKS